MAKAQIGVIGGSGLYSMPGLEKAREVRIATPFGMPSDAYIVGYASRAGQVAFLARHGRGHVISPSELNFRANIYGFKKLGVERIISVSAVGSLREDFRPDGHGPARPSSVDRTRQRISTFFGGGLVAHVGFDTPVCPDVVDVLAKLVPPRACRFTRAGRIFAWRVRRFPPRRNRTFIGHGAWTSSE